LEVFKDLNSKFLRPFCQTPGGQNLAIFESASGQLAQASRGSQLALETLHYSPLALPLSPLYLPSPKPGRRTEEKPPQLSPRLPSESLHSPYPVAPAAFMGAPQLETTPSNPPLPFSVPETIVLRCTRPPSVPTAAAYKRSPFLAEKIHTIPSNLPDILLSLLALSIELARAGRAPRAPRVPDDSDRSPTCRRSRAAEKDPLRRLDIPATAPHHPSVSTAIVPLPGSRSLCPVGLGKKPSIPIRCLSYDSRVPLSKHFFCLPRPGLP
jgi:hypothetical protein